MTRLSIRFFSVVKRSSVHKLQLGFVSESGKKCFSSQKYRVWSQFLKFGCNQNKHFGTKQTHGFIDKEVLKDH